MLQTHIPIQWKWGKEKVENKHIFQKYDVQVEHITSVISICLELSKVAMSSCQQSLGDIIPSWASTYPAKFKCRKRDSITNRENDSMDCGKN